MCGDGVGEFSGFVAADFAHQESGPSHSALDLPALAEVTRADFQNGNEKSLARIMVAVIAIGLIGVMLDRIMMALQALASKNRTV